MSFYNNQPNFYVNSNFDAQTYCSNSVESSSNDYLNQPSASNQVVNVSHSTLLPTAQEFHPLNYSTSSSSGAVKKKPQNDRFRYRDNGRIRNNRYGSGRTFNGSKYDNKNDRSHSGEERSKIFTDPPNLMRNYEQDYTENNDESHSQNSYYSNNTKSFKENRSSEFQSKHFNYRDNKDKYGRNYMSRSKDDENIETNFQKPRSNVEGSQRCYESPSKNIKANGRAFDKSNRSNFYGNERSNYEKQPRNNSYYERSEKNNYYDRNNSYYERTPRNDTNEKSNKNSGVGQFDDNNYVERKDFKPGFKPYYETNRNNKYEGKAQKDWRKLENTNKDRRDKEYAIKLNKKFDGASQRERLEQMLNRHILECLVCCEKIKHTDKVWTCMQCYHILHLNCVAAWAKSSKVENGWRCPACQNVCTEVPRQYKCYCGKTVDPKYDPGTIPHGCGNICLRKGRTCDHKCTILCHPGPCPDCNIMVAKSCGCGATQPIVKCSTDLEIVCDAVCNKILECGIHRCTAQCHSGSCNPCDHKIIQECYCGKQGRKVSCTMEIGGKTQYACEDVCGKTLSCGNHTCQKACHEGDCGSCSRDVNKIKTCPCGKTVLGKPRTSCLDPIPCCDKTCGKTLKCGQPSAPHKCRERCHEGDCPPCPLTTVVRCRCGHMDKELPCQKLTTKADDARCEKKCTKKRMCGKHKCNQRCCIEIEHFCPLPCNHQLSCGQHRCERTCHSGRCPPCMETSFEELYCECGASVLYPPIPCGTKPPHCNKPCSRERPCGHEANHSCHTGPCPPCTVLCKRWCYGHHEQRSAIPCHQQNFGCGLPCGKPMPCGRHKCVKPCHEGPCPMPCKQPCTVRRTLCGHPCGKPCHEPPCPESSCKQMVSVTCLCGLQKGTRPCIDVAEEFRNIEMAQLKDKIGDLSKDQPVDISDIVSNTKKPTILKILECTEECRVLERNRRLAIGLQIRNPDLSQKLTPRYTDFMRQWAKKDTHFCQRVHDKLTELVQLAKQSKQKSRSYSFESMNRDKRHFIHEYCEHFGVESAAYDMEPNRNIVATAVKDKSWLPSMSLLEVIQRENGQRKVPGPVSVLSRSTIKPETVSLKLPSRNQRPSSPPGEVIDYFDPPL